MGTPEFPDLGRHCSVESCQQIDFLPFNCDACRKVFCLEHRLQATHSCPSASAGNVTAIVCPLCASSVRCVDGEDPNVTWERHCASKACNPANYQRATKKERCAAAACKQVLSAANTVVCRECGRRVCIRHRFGADHLCSRALVQPAQAGPSLSTLWEAGSQYGERVVEGVSSAVAGLWAAPGAAAPPASAAAGSARQRAAAAVGAPGSSSGSASSSGRRRQDVQPTGRQRGDRASPAGAPPAAPAAAPAGGECCPQCGAGFPDAVALVRHFEAAHSAGGQQRQAGAGRGRGGRAAQGRAEQCPQCGQRFADAVALVQHVQRQHPSGGERSEQCVVQ